MSSCSSASLLLYLFVLIYTIKYPYGYDSLPFSRPLSRYLSLSIFLSLPHGHLVRRTLISRSVCTSLFISLSLYLSLSLSLSLSPWERRVGVYRQIDGVKHVVRAKKAKLSWKETHNERLLIDRIFLQAQSTLSGALRARRGLRRKDTDNREGDTYC